MPTVDRKHPTMIGGHVTTVAWTALCGVGAVLVKLIENLG
jgi:hypothetical protein